MSHMNGITRKKKYAKIVHRDNEYCKCCGVLPHERELIIHHKDNNNFNNNLNNLVLLCRTCNYNIHPRLSERPVDLRVSENEKEIPTEMEVNRTMKPRFQLYVGHILNEKGQESEKELVNGGAQHLGISSVTTKRYMNELCSKDGPYYKKTVGKTNVISWKAEMEMI